MLKTKEVQQAFSTAVTNIKRRKHMANMKFPLLEKKGYKIYFYFTDATDTYYSNILGEIMRRKSNKIVEAPRLFCFDYDHKRDGWFIDDVPELVDRIEDLFEEYYDERVAPELKKRGSKS